MCRNKKMLILFGFLYFFWLMAAITPNRINTSKTIDDNLNQFEYNDDFTEFKTILPKSSVQAVNVCITEVRDNGSSYEWIEVYNPTGSIVDLTGWIINDSENMDVNLGTLVGSIDPGEIITIGDAGANPNYTASPFTLNSGGDDLLLIDNLGQIQDAVLWGSGASVNDAYKNTWFWKSSTTVPDPTDAQSLQRINITIGGELEDNNLPSDWIVSNTPTMGTLPQYNPKHPETGSLIISEVMYGGSDNEWIEIVNTEDTELNISKCVLHSYKDGNITEFPDDTYLKPYSTYIIGEPAIYADLQREISLNDVGDVIVLKNETGINLDVASWGSGANNFTYGSQNGWISALNATGGLPENESIFRYNFTKTILSDTNSSSDWYVTSNPTPNGFYEIMVGDLFFTEISMRSNPGEFIELYNNLTWPITLEGVYVRDFGLPDDEIIFNESAIINPKEVITAGDSYSNDYQVSISLDDNSEDLVLYRDISMSYELDVIIYGNSVNNKYPWGFNTGWYTSANVSLSGITQGDTIQRLNGSNYELIDTNTSADWRIIPATPGFIPDFILPGIPNSVLITEIMIDPNDETHGEYIEIYNTLDTPVDISDWTIWYDNFNSVQASFPLNTTLPAHTYLAIVDDASYANSEYGFIGLNLTVALSLSGSSPKDVILADFYFNIIDRFAWRMSSLSFVDSIDPASWQDNGVYIGSEGKSLSRLYDPANNDSYIDTNSSSDWRYSTIPNLGKHTNTVWFLSRPVIGNASVIAFSSPDNSYAAITGLIDKAQNSIDMCIYQFTSYYILQHLLDAMNRGVQVRLILEDSYPGASVHSTDDPTAHEVVYVAKTIDNHVNGTTKWEGYAGGKYTHAKYFIIDNNTITILTENFKATGVPKDPSYGNRGWGISINNTNLADLYLKVFELDWSVGKPFNIGDVVAPLQNTDIFTGAYVPISTYQSYEVINSTFHTVVGPDETIDVIVDLIDSATSTIYGEIFYMYPTWTGYPGGINNNPFLKALINAVQRGVDIKIILDSTFYNLADANDNDEAAQVMRAHGIEVKYSYNSNGIEKFHVKGFIVDQEAVMISSLNWNENSATNNREIGVIVNSSLVASYYVGVFLHDWDRYASEEIPDYEETGIPLTYFWLQWLPIISIIYIGILVSGYSVRHQKEKSIIKKRKIKDKALEKRKQLTETAQEIPSEIPININAARENIHYFYGDAVKMSHLNFDGTPLDNIIPSQFIINFIEYNHDMIEFGKPIRPIPQILILKYHPEKYIAIEGTMQLNLRLLDEKVKLRVSELEKDLNLKDIELKNYQNKLKTIEDKLNILESTIPEEETRKGKKSNISSELKRKETLIRKMKEKMKIVEHEKSMLERDLNMLTGGEMVPLSDLINELQLKIKKQSILIKKLEEITKEEPKYGHL